MPEEETRERAREERGPEKRERGERGRMRRGGEKREEK
jgi:hypothetical protein